MTTKQPNLQLCPTCNAPLCGCEADEAGITHYGCKHFPDAHDGDMCVRCEGESTKNDSTGEMDWDSAVAMAAGKGSMLQWIQTEVWEYMDTPKLKRDGVDLAKRIYDEVANQAIAQERERNKVTGETSDGYHTFNELYEFRKVLNAVLFNEWYARGRYSVHKSERHADGEPCFGGGWFIVMATLPTGQISNHYEMKDWDLFKCEERERADTWDGHEAKDVIDRLLHIINKEHD